MTKPNRTQTGADDTSPRQEIALNAYETGEALVLVAPMPGVRPDDVTITVEGDCVVLEAGLRTAAPKDYLLHEWDYGSYRRAAHLADGYGEPVIATLGNGQLAVRLTRGGSRPDDGRIVVHPSAPAAADQ